MSKWPGRYVVGLTGNIGTGKTVVRKMLEHLGAYGIDADALAHRAIAKEAPGYDAVLHAFGRWLLDPDGNIDRKKLARLVFSDPTALSSLESIVHPLVEKAIDYLIQRSTQPVIVLEAIKLLESNLGAHCDTIWVTHISPEIQLARLIKDRNMDEREAHLRMDAQPSQDTKLAKAHVVIQNGGNFEQTWKQVSVAWKKHIMAEEPVAPLMAIDPAEKPSGPISIRRARPGNSADIADLLTRLRKNLQPVTAQDIMAAFGEKAFLLVFTGDQPVGVIGWQVENLVSRTTEIVLDPNVPQEHTLPVMIAEMERASRDLQCEASIIFITPEMSRLDSIWRSLGYERRTPQTLGVVAWQEAALESQPPSTILLFKQLRTDRILRPI